MVKIRALAIIGFLAILGSRAVAMSPQEVPAEVKACKTIADDQERLKCFDGLLGATPKPEKSEEGKQANWSIEETKSPTDGTPQVIAANLVGNTVLILRCKEQTTEAAFSTQFNYLGYKSVVSGGWRPLRRRLDFGRQRAVTEDIQAARATCSREAAQVHGRSSLSRLFGQRLTRRTRTWAK